MANLHINGLNGKIMKDHTGRVFSSECALCDFWGIKRQTFQTRIANGLTMEEALTRPRRVPSIAEVRIAKFLAGNGITFLHDRKLSTAIKVFNIKREFYLDKEDDIYRYDFIFCIEGELFVIEYDGQQHFKQKDIANLKKQHERDLRKNQICAENGIHLLRVSYEDASDMFFYSVFYRIACFLDTWNTVCCRETDFSSYYEEYYAYIAEQGMKNEV